MIVSNTDYSLTLKYSYSVHVSRFRDLDRQILDVKKDFNSRVSTASRSLNSADRRSWVLEACERTTTGFIWSGFYCFPSRKSIMTGKSMNTLHLFGAEQIQEEQGYTAVPYNLRFDVYPNFHGSPKVKVGWRAQGFQQFLRYIVRTCENRGPRL